MMLLRRFRALLPLAMLALFISSCGIDTYVYLYPVSVCLNVPSSSDPTYNFFSFRTSDSKNYDEYGSDSYFRGFEIYYKIYNSESQRSADVSAIYSYNDSNPTSALAYLTGTKGYKRMVHTGRTTDIPLIPASSSDRTVSIRLTDQSTYTAQFLVAGTNLGIPMRPKNEGTSFLSFDYDDISTSDTDVLYTSTSSIDAWYVQAYVVVYGYDDSYKTSYSEVFSLYDVTVLP
jgi:hypothetical protein